jgi:predicted nucleic acid-binding protein
MNSLSFPDINVWLAVAAPERVHAAIARRWWAQETGIIAFSRLTQLGFRRLMTKAAVMDGKPLTVTAAWSVYDRLRRRPCDVCLGTPRGGEAVREKASGRTASPKVWADAWQLAVAQAAEGVLVTLDKTLASRGAYCLLVEKRGKHQG